MSDDFDIAALAEYLHVTPAQVTRMADRGKLPGRKIGGGWRFSRAEIHHWLEEQIGVSDDSELARVGQVLSNQGGTSDSIDEFLQPAAISIPLPARTRSSVISSMVELAGETGLLWDTTKMIEAVRARENLHPTALDNGVALLHPRRPLASILAEPFLVLGKTSQAIPFGGRGGSLTDIFFLICSVDDAGHLALLARLSRLIGDSDFVSALRQTESRDEAESLMTDAVAGLEGV